MSRKERKEGRQASGRALFHSFVICLKPIVQRASDYYNVCTGQAVQVHGETGTDLGTATLRQGRNKSPGDKKVATKLTSKPHMRKSNGYIFVEKGLESIALFDKTYFVDTRCVGNESEGGRELH